MGGIIIIEIVLFGKYFGMVVGICLYEVEEDVMRPAHFQGRIYIKTSFFNCFLFAYN
jgi:hypothetical protein